MSFGKYVREIIDRGEEFRKREEQQQIAKAKRITREVLSEINKFVAAHSVSKRVLNQSQIEGHAPSIQHSDAVKDCPSTDAVQSSFGYLGLSVDRTARTIRRDGHFITVDLSCCPRLWETFCAFFDGCERGCTKEAWRNAVTGETGDENLRSHRKNLKERLAPLSLTIPRDGRRIVDDGT